ncbi:hypothetical protein [Tunturiibacter gelidiferens]|uniref:hypothetical protein n=1 Tax=Tunturiibacter gelidiferens TaxID=3069689 RepID=UPI003D9B5A6D
MACMAGIAPVAGMGRTLRVFVRLRAIAMAALLTAGGAWGQVASSAGSQTVTDVLHEMSDRADVIFMGQVLTVRLPGGAGPTSGIVEVDFRVDQAIRGCRAGEPYVLREWGGLWAGNSQRYRVGQRMLMLLHAPSAGGMSSPVGGLDGAIPIRQSTRVAAVAESATEGPSLPFVDLRWLGARLARAVSYRSGPVRPADAFPQSRATQQQVVTAGSTVGDVILPLGYRSAADASIPAQQASVDVVLGLLNSWQKAQHVTP